MKLVGFEAATEVVMNSSGVYSTESQPITQESKLCLLTAGYITNSAVYIL
jgi:hypothetical protein